MYFVRLSLEEYADFAVRQGRLFLPQTPEYGRVKAKQGLAVEYVGVRDESTHLVAAGIIVIQPWKKLFQRAVMNYGPAANWDQLEVANTFLEGVSKFLRHRYPRVLAFQISPLAPARIYRDVTVTEDPAPGPDLDNLLTGRGFRRIDQEFYENPDIQIRYIYTKDIEGLSFDEATATLSKTLRRRFHNEGRYGVQTRFLTSDDFGVFNQLHESAAERTDMAEISSGSRDFYQLLMDELGPDRAFLCVAYFSPARYMKQIVAEHRASVERREVLLGRPVTKNRDREIAQIEERLDTLAGHSQEASQTYDTYGDTEIPINGALSFICGNELILLLGGMDKRFAQFARDYPVERAMFKLACDKGLSVYNTFGISGQFGADAIDSQVLTFKRLLKGNVEEFIGTYNLPLRPYLAERTGASPRR